MSIILSGKNQTSKRLQLVKKSKRAKKGNFKGEIEQLARHLYKWRPL